MFNLNRFIQFSFGHQFLLLSTFALSCAEGLSAQTFLDFPLGANSSTFLAKVTCHVECKKKAPKERAQDTRLSLTDIFDPQAEGLRRGNGNLWAPLGAGLWIFSQIRCERAALEHCGSDNLAHYNVEAIKSGTWSLEVKPTCTYAKDQALLSPFDTEFELDKVMESFSKKENSWQGIQGRPAFARGVQVESGIRILEQDGKEACGTRKKVEICYGDCVSLCGESKEQLCTSAPGARKELNLCVDDFVKVEAPMGSSAAEIELKCEQSLWSAILENDSLMIVASCSAVRLSNLCHDVARDLNGERAAVKKRKITTPSPSSCIHCN